MDLIRKQPVFCFSLVSILTLTVLSGVAVAKMHRWNFAHAQGETVAADSSFACEPLVFTLSATEEATPSGSPRTSASPTGTPAAGKGGVSPSPSATSKASATATATAKASSTATAKPTSTSTATKGGLPEAGVSTPTVAGIAVGIFLLLAAALLAL